MPTAEGHQTGPRRPGMVALGRRLRELRGLRGQGEVARAAGISRGYLSELEQGKRPRPRLPTLARLATALGTTLEALQLPPQRPGLPESGPGGAGAATPAAAARRGIGGSNGNGGTPTEQQPEGGAGAPRPTPPAGLFRVYRWGTMGDPRTPAEAPEPLGYERVPVGKEQVVGMVGFSVIVKGDGLRGWRGRVKDGDFCWVNPALPVRTGHLVVALILDPAIEDDGMGVYELASAEDAGGAERVGGPTVLRTWPERGQPQVVPTQRFRVLGPVVGIMSWRSPDEGRARRLGAQELEEQRYGAEGGRGGPAVPPGRSPERPPRVNAPPLAPPAPEAPTGRQGLDRSRYPGHSHLIRILKA